MFVEKVQGAFHTIVGPRMATMGAIWESKVDPSSPSEPKRVQISPRTGYLFVPGEVPRGVLLGTLAILLILLSGWVPGRQLVLGWRPWEQSGDLK